MSAARIVRHVKSNEVKAFRSEANRHRVHAAMSGRPAVAGILRLAMKGSRMIFKAAANKTKVSL